MNKELEIWRFAAERLKQSESVMLLIVAESAGSSPGRQGFKMIVARDDLRGSIGGGVMEIRLVEQAKLNIQNEELKINSEIVEQVHRKNSPGASGMICSGKQTIVFYKLDSSHLKTVREIIHALEKHQPKILRLTPNEFRVFVSKCSPPISMNLLIKNRNDELSECERELLTRLPPRMRCYKRSLNKRQFFQPTDFRFVQMSNKDFIFEENLGFKNKLFIIGGGHCALALSEIMSKMDFHISLFDDRANLNTFVENRFAHEKRTIENYAQIGDFVWSGAHHFVVVMTVGYKSDEIVIRKLLDKNFRYFGVLGSRAKIKTLLKNLEKEGFDASKLNEIRAPVGLPIGSRTPEEIAVSIAAEIIGVKNAGD